MENKNWSNPFSEDRVEDWRVEEHPENYKKIASLFSPPDFMEKLEDTAITKAIFVYGGRGCGKSHILRRMSIQSEIENLVSKYNEDLKFDNFEKSYFGIYVKTDRFSPLSNENITYLGVDKLAVLFEHLFNLEVTKSIIEGIKFVIKHFEEIPSTTENAICEKIDAYLNSKGIKSFSNILSYLDCQAKAITKLTKNYVFDDDYSKYSKDIEFTQVPDFILKIYDIISNEISLLKGKSLILLLDEFESLDENQQSIINQIIKSRRLTLRIAVKIRGIKTLNTKTGQNLEELHDYLSIDLHFNLDNKNISKYKSLLRTIFEKRLLFKDVYEGSKGNNPEVLLPSPSLKDVGITEEEIINKLIEMGNVIKKGKKDTNSKVHLDNYKGHYRKAAIFRILRDKGKNKHFAGFDEYVSLSSGIVRLFIWLCREAFALAYQNNIDVLSGKPINVSLQSRAALNVAKNELTITIPRAINSIYASKLAYFIHDIGQILRAKLYYSTEPQANRIEIVDPEMLDKEEYNIPKELIESGMDLPVFFYASSFKPRDMKTPFPDTFMLNRIFAPLLQVPLESRWRTKITSDELKALCLSESRGEALAEIVNKIKNKHKNVRKKKGSINKEQKGQKSLALEIEFQKPITLANCPVTGSGCDRTLKCYDKSSKTIINAFLAIEFDDDSWTHDPRRWIKDELLEYGIVCKDIGEFDNLNYFLCKYCSCVRQYKYGLFEITELNHNVIFEFGMATGLNRTNFLFVFKKKIPPQHKNDYPPAFLNGIEYIPYDLSPQAISKVLREKVKPVIDALEESDDNKECRIISSQCPHKTISTDKKRIFVGLPSGEIFNEVYSTIEEITKPLDYIIDRHLPAKSLDETCQICIKVKESSICIIDTTYNDFSMLFALGIAFGKDKKFIQLHNIGLDNDRPISDLRKWAIEYRNIEKLKTHLVEELPKRLETI